MEASPARVIQYFDGQKQNLIPLFQRQYTWTEKNCQTLWDDLMVQYESEEPGAHFMGAIVSVPARSVPVGVSKHVIIDGQQRLTTVSLLLCALRDCLNLIDPNSASRIQDVYLLNIHASPDDVLKFVPTQGDRDAYRGVALDRQVPKHDKNVLIATAYHFFKNKLSSGTDINEDPIDPAKVLTTLEECLQVVMINLSDNDDPYLIFESLNDKGESLTEADLVRNYVLMRFQHSIAPGGEQDRIHSQYWKPLEDMLHDESKSHLTDFLRHYIMKDGNNIKKGGVYAAIRTKLKSMTSQAIEVEVQSMQSFGNFYAKFLDPSQEKIISISQRLSNIKELEVGTSYPLLLRLFNARHTGYLNDIDLDKCLGLVESFVVRRAVCRVPSRSLSTMFIQWAKNFPETDHVQWLHSALSSGTNSSRFPKDDEFALAFTTHKQYGLANTGFILRHLEKSFNHKEVVNLSTPTIEHILPQTITQEWKDELGSEAENVHFRLIDTFGNLTLTGYNSELGNLQFSDKKYKLENTHIELNRWILEQSNWRSQEIEERANILLSIANKIWLSPIVS